MSWLSWLDTTFCMQLLLTLAHFLWQAAALAAIAIASTWILRRRSARSRYRVHVVALILMAACPPITFAIIGSTAPIGKRNAYSSPQLSTATPSIAAGMDRHSSAPAPLGQPATKSPPAEASTATARANESPAPRDLAGSRSGRRSLDWQAAAPYLMAGYVAGVILMLGRLFIGLYGGRRLRRTSRPIEDGRLLTTLDVMARRLRLRFTPLVLYCDRVGVPTVIGVLRPAILLPVSLGTGLTPAQIDGLVTHELAHIHRYDHLVNIVQRLIEAFLFFHPAVWIVSRRIRIERENCCDDLVLALGAEPLSYAASLVELAEQSRSSRPARRLQPALHAASGRSELRARIQRLIGGEPARPVRLGPAGAFVFTAVVMTSLAALLVNVRAAPMEETEPSAEPKPAHEEGPSHRVALDGGGWIELAGVTTRPLKGATWWKPDGTPLAAGPYDDVKTIVKPGPGEVAYEFAFRVHNPKKIDFRLGGSSSTTAASNSAASRMNVENEQGGVEYLSYAMTLRKSLETASFDLRLGEGEWTTRASTTGGESAMGHRDWGIVFADPYERDETTVLCASHDLNPENSQSRLVAIGKDGSEHAPTAHSAASARRVVQLTAEFKLPRNQIKEFRFQTRPYRWVQFKDISLKAGRETKFEVAAARSPGDKMREAGAALIEQRDLLDPRQLAGASTLATPASRKQTAAVSHPLSLDIAADGTITAKARTFKDQSLLTVMNDLVPVETERPGTPVVLLAEAGTHVQHLLWLMDALQLLGFTRIDAKMPGSLGVDLTDDSSVVRLNLATNGTVTASDGELPKGADLRTLLDNSTFPGYGHRTTVVLTAAPDVKAQHLTWLIDLLQLHGFQKFVFAAPENSGSAKAATKSKP